MPMERTSLVEEASAYALPESANATALSLVSRSEGHTGETGLHAREEWKLACRIAASRGMAKSELLPRFLLHVCEMSLRGRQDEITEQRIGTLIFKRPPGYNPGEDNIVRSYARTMRKRLDEYFAEDGRHETMRLSIPRGGYVPVFQPVSSLFTANNDEANVAPAPNAKPPAMLPDTQRNIQMELSATRQVRARALWVAGLLGLVTGALLVASVWLWWTSRKGAEISAAHALWSQLFVPNRETLLVPADSGLGILQNLSKHSVNVDQYASGAYLNQLASAGIDARNFADIGQQRYTSIADLNIVARVGRLPEYLSSRTLIRYARGVTADDMKTSNAVLIGSKHTNPWVALYERNMDFTLEYSPAVDESLVANRRPTKGEQPFYKNAAPGSTEATYGVIAFLPSLDGSGHVLILEGLNMAATEAAAEVLFQENLIRPVLRQATDAAGNLRPFELLIGTNSIGATAPEAHILATHIHESGSG